MPLSEVDFWLTLMAPFARTFLNDLVSVVEIVSKAGGEPAPVEVNTWPSVPGPTATGLPDAS